MPCVVSAAPAPSAALGDQDSIALQVIFTYSDSHTKRLENGSTIRYDSERSGVFEATLKRYQAYSGVDSFEFEGAAKGSVTVHDRMIYQTGGTVTREEFGSGPPTDSAANVHIDPERGVYSFTVSIGTDTQVTLQGPGAPAEPQQNNTGVSYESGDLPLPLTKDVIRGSARFDPPLGSNALGGNIVAEGRVMKQLDGAAQQTVQIHWQIGRPGPRPPLELVLSVDGYEGWLPEGPRPDSPRAPGNQARVVAKLKRKDGKPLERGATVVRFTLPESSTEPGVCLNFPLEAAADPKDHDLRFVTGGDAAPVGEGAQEAETAPGDWQQATAQVGAFDWGAYGKLSAVAYVPGYGEVLGVLEGTNERFVRLPKRSADSFIGDAWKKAHGVESLSDDDDAETSEGNQNHGDGYTLYEEYRGLFARGKHSRQNEEAQLDPKRKDLAVLLAKRARTATYTVGGVPATYQLQPIGAHFSTVRSGTHLLENAVSRAHVVLLDQDEAPESRRINQNSKYGNRGAQHGVLLYALAGTPDAAGGSDVGVALPLDRFNKTPQKADLVAIDFASVAGGYDAQKQANDAAGLPMPFTAEQEASNTVAHELAHACGVSHHGDRESGSPLTQFEAEHVPPKYVIKGVDGSPVTQRPFTLHGTIAGDESRASGDLSCIMAYPNYYAWRLKPVRGVGYVWQALMPGPMGTTLCTGRDSAVPNATFGPAAPGRGNCRAKVRFKDY